MAESHIYLKPLFLLGYESSDNISSLLQLSLCQAFPLHPDQSGSVAGSIQRCPWALGVCMKSMGHPSAPLGSSHSSGISLAFQGPCAGHRNHRQQGWKQHIAGSTKGRSVSQTSKHSRLGRGGLGSGFNLWPHFLLPVGPMCANFVRC